MRAIRAASEVRTSDCPFAGAPRPALLAAAALLVLALRGGRRRLRRARRGGLQPVAGGHRLEAHRLVRQQPGPHDFTITAQFADGRIGGTSAVNQLRRPLHDRRRRGVLRRRARQHDDGRPGAGHAGGADYLDAARRRRSSTRSTARRSRCWTRRQRVADLHGDDRCLAGRLRHAWAVSAGRAG